MTEVVRLSFNGLGTTALTWFAKSQLLTSPWTDIQWAPVNYFNIEGTGGDRRFFINSKYSTTSCYGDEGWFVVLDASDICGWSQRSAYPAFSYLNGSSKQNWFFGN
ncbi:uncharacterized protein LOC135467535 [Liolophura sinensis]|uniref:uncharacterized protein LOC135467535 n=1 Tax=Liolophura sinensis TaxID=3198878 RepID=UPI0031587792